MSTVDDLMARVWTLVRSGPNFDGRDKELRAALESALQAEYERGRRQGITDVHDKLRTEQAAEPVAWISRCIATGRTTYGALPIQSIQPGAYKHSPLYASPPKREPLLSSAIVTMYAESPSSDADMIEFARAIERAHGIGDE